MTRFLAVPQWQGSPSSRAMSLQDGTAAIVGDLPRSRVTHVNVPLEAGDAIATGVSRASAIAAVREAMIESFPDADGEHTLVIGGDGSVSVPAIAHLASKDLAVVWFDARGALHTPETNPGGAFATMSLQAIQGVGAAPLANRGTTAVPGNRIVLAGARDLDIAEYAAAAEVGITQLDVDETAREGALVDAVRTTGALRVYVHVDLSVLDPAQITGIADALPFGISSADLVSSIRALREAFPLVGATLAGFSPRSPDAAVEDLGTILRIVGALA